MMTDVVFLADYHRLDSFASVSLHHSKTFNKCTKRGYQVEEELTAERGRKFKSLRPFLLCNKNRLPIQRFIQNIAKLGTRTCNLFVDSPAQLPLHYQTLNFVCLVDLYIVRQHCLHCSFKACGAENYSLNYKGYHYDIPGSTIDSKNDGKKLKTPPVSTEVTEILN